MANQYLPGVIQIPSTLLITNITRGAPMVITATVPSTGANTYIPGQLIRLLIPKSYGMYQANGLVCKIISINGLFFTVNVNSELFDPFVLPSSNQEAPASFAPFGSQNLQYNNTTDQVGFQSLNNIGN